MKNKYIIESDKTILIIESKKYGIIKVFVDRDQIPKIKNIKWHYQKNKDSAYIGGRLNGKMVKLHRYILGVTDSTIIIDHKDRNTLNNCKDNLRLATYQQNNFNKNVRNDNKSGYTGVRLLKTGKWIARIKYNGKIIHLGYFDNISEAVLNRQIAEEKLFGEFNTVKKLITDNLIYINEALENVNRRLEGKIDKNKKIC